jgi:hypothetical protein
MSRRAVTVRRAVDQAIWEERSRQDARWGPLPRGLEQGEWLGVLMEEVGEVATETITRTWTEDGPPEGVIDYDRLSAELVQVAAVAIAWLEELGLTDD